jgi:U3 small nucleolar ribonucleoprotein component
MEIQEVYDPTVDYKDEIPAESESTSLARSKEFLPTVQKNGNSRAMRRMEEQEQMDAAQERCKARLMAEVISNTCTLSAIAAQAAQAVPSCARAVEHIVNVFAATSAERIARRY